MKCNQHAIELPLLLLFLRDVDVGQKTSHSEPKIHYVLLFFYCILLLIEQYFAMKILFNGNRITYHFFMIKQLLHYYCPIFCYCSNFRTLYIIRSSFMESDGEKIGLTPTLILDLCSGPEIQQVALNADKKF